MTRYLYPSTVRQSWHRTMHRKRISLVVPQSQYHIKRNIGYPPSRPIKNTLIVQKSDKPSKGKTKYKLVIFCY
ncbi:hypothetical protein PILCRDRAFT_813177 [Piloderma croceum F 1598]|uniref:Uncharacterized protein n=1 Tax=Piloderma croceum (strain F 1598) TaxID=765440 RepID=A0A0C3BRV6_PILCF|nr:hypothetical protein PILCRDRAFT_813177 [Piloderma croceum F 1598]